MVKSKSHLDVEEKRSRTKQIVTINLPIWIIALVKKITDAGIVESRSELFRQLCIQGLYKYFLVYAPVVDQELGYMNADEIFEYERDREDFIAAADLHKKYLDRSCPELKKLVVEAQKGYWAKQQRTEWKGK
jgi:hypothetical protein